MGEQVYSINIKDVTASEYFLFVEEFEDYKEVLLMLLKAKGFYHFEDTLIRQFKNNAKVQQLIAEGIGGMEAIIATKPNTFISAGNQIKTEGGEQASAPAWYYLLHGYTITPSDVLFDYFLAYHLRHCDLLLLDNALDYLLENYYGGNTAAFSRFLKLTLRKHGERLLQPGHTDTINEWMAEKEKAAVLAGTEEPQAKLKRVRDDKVTVLNQEQVALLVYCLQQAGIILSDKLLNRKDAGLAFSILTGYSPDTIRQNLSKDEIMSTATAKNAVAVQKALQSVLNFIDNTVMPE
jgi:hypothetical protein